MRFILACFITSFALLASGCTTTPKAGGASGMTVGGGAAGASSQGEKSPIEHCDESLGTLAIDEDRSADWWNHYYTRYPKLGSTIPVLRLIVQQSNCMVVVERGRSMNNMMRERRLMSSGELRGGSNFGKGQMVAADFTMQPSLQFAAKGTGGLGGGLGGMFGVIGAVAAKFKSNEAAATLLLVENRSGVQVSAATGSAKNWDVAGFGGGWFGAFAGVGGYSNTPEGKVIITALVDAYNNMVKALRNYKAQTVKGGLGKGGRLKIGD